jgi:hypothetical protein
LVTLTITNTSNLLRGGADLLDHQTENDLSIGEKIY